MKNFNGLHQAMKARGKSRRGVRNRRSGVILMLACFCLPVLMALMGLAVDSGVLYSLKTKLQMSVDGAAIAGIRATSLAQSVSAQQTAVDNVASHWFNANFTAGYLGTTNTVLTTPNLASSGGLNSVTVTASTDVPSYFMKYFEKGATTITARGVAARQAANIMMVLDRSGSMAGTPCSQMITAAKQFTGIFTPGVDRIGLVTFAEAVSVDSAPTSAFQTTLGYTNSGGSNTGKLDSIVCNGGTNTSAAIALAWNELYKAALPGTNNFILLFTDGEPTASTFNLSGVIKSSSGCKDALGNSASSGLSNFATFPANWTGSDSNAVDILSNKIITFGTGSYWAPMKGMIAAFYAGGGTSLYGADPWFVPAGATYASQENRDKYTNLTAPTAPQIEAPGCNFASATTDFAMYPATDIFGMSTSGYQTISNTLTATNGRLVNFNLADNIAAWARKETAASQLVNYSGTTTPMPSVTFHVIGLGSNGGVDTTLLTRIANSAQTSSGPQGLYFYAPTASQLSAAFYSMGSSQFRLSQ